jgi:hypothetical protein
MQKPMLIFPFFQMFFAYNFFGTFFRTRYERNRNKNKILNFDTLISFLKLPFLSYLPFLQALNAYAQRTKTFPTLCSTESLFIYMQISVSLALNPIRFRKLKNLNECDTVVV